MERAIARLFILIIHEFYALSQQLKFVSWTRGEFGIEVDQDNPAFPTSFWLFLCWLTNFFLLSCVFSHNRLLNQFSAACNAKLSLEVLLGQLNFCQPVSSKMVGDPPFVLMNFQTSKTVCFSCSLRWDGQSCWFILKKKVQLVMALLDHSADGCNIELLFYKFMIFFSFFFFPDFENFKICVLYEFFRKF